MEDHLKGEIWLTAPAPGAWNMALDQAMVDSAYEMNKVILRIYQWSEPTLSLGYFQKHSERFDIPELSSLPCVRRVTGGGAIIHDQELTYSIALPNITSSKGPSQEVYESIHRSIVYWLNSLGCSSRLYRDIPRSGESPLALPTTDGTCKRTECDSFLCFERRADVDIVIGTSKVLGSAQRRTNKGLLQHGSLLWRASEVRTSLTGVAELVPAVVSLAQADLLTQFSAAIRGGLESHFQVDFCAAEPSAATKAKTNEFLRSTFLNTSWTEKK